MTRTHACTAKYLTLFSKFASWVLVCYNSWRRALIIPVVPEWWLSCCLTPMISKSTHKKRTKIHKRILFNHKFWSYPKQGLAVQATTQEAATLPILLRSKKARHSVVTHSPRRSTPHDPTFQSSSGPPTDSQSNVQQPCWRASWRQSVHRLKWKGKTLKQPRFKCRYGNIRFGEKKLPFGSCYILQCALCSQAKLKIRSWSKTSINHMIENAQSKIIRDMMKSRKQR